VFIITSGSAWAQCVQNKDDCIPGLPCNVCLTENQPTPQDQDGPNRSIRGGGGPAPNEPKHDNNKTCDADLMNQIYGKAYLESERHNIMAETILRKPDSVLQYSCFDQVASLTATVGAKFFTESEQWDDEQVLIEGELNREDIDDTREVKINTYMEDDRQDKSIKEVVLKSLKKYIDDNFRNEDNEHRLLGGASAQTAEPTGEIHTSGYLCSLMRTIYYEAKCDNFNVDDPFYSFRSLSVAVNDPREHPKNCRRINGNQKPIDPDMIDLAENKNFEYAAFDRITNTYLEDIFGPNKTEKTCDEVTPIETGVEFTIKTFISQGPAGTQKLQSSQDYKDAVCAKPGCYYNGTECAQ